MFRRGGGEEGVGTVSGMEQRRSEEELAELGENKGVMLSSASQQSGPRRRNSGVGGDGGSMEMKRIGGGGVSRRAASGRSPG